MIKTNSISTLNHLACKVCNNPWSSNTLQTFASCDKCSGNPLVAVYDLPNKPPHEIIYSKISSMWRYARLLPVQEASNIVTLGEGWTPIIPLKKLASQLGIENISLKDESLNPTGSFKARGLSATISRAKELNIRRCIIPTAGNAGVAAAAYCARAGIHAVVIMPEQTPESFKIACQLYGAELILVNGFISDCAALARKMNSASEYFDLSTMKEPYRLEGKKTLGYEIAEQSNFELPDVILYPTGGGTGLIGIWKAFKEMQAMGWITDALPQMIAVQSDNCKPIVNATIGLNQPLNVNHTIAYGLAVPTPFAKSMILDVIHESKGCAIAVSDVEIMNSLRELATCEGTLVSPEGASLIAALKHLIQQGQVQSTQKILLLNTGSADKYLMSLGDKRY